MLQFEQSNTSYYLVLDTSHSHGLYNFDLYIVVVLLIKLHLVLNICQG